MFCCSTRLLTCARPATGVLRGRGVLVQQLVRAGAARHPHTEQKAPLQHHREGKHVRSGQPQQKDAHNARGHYTSANMPWEGAAGREQEREERAPASPPSDNPWRISSAAHKFKDVIKKYGAVAVCFHGSVFATTLASIYAALRSGVDVTAALSHIPLIDLEALGASRGSGTEAAGQLAVAYAATLVTGPARAVLTVVATPKVAHLWHAHIKPRPAPIIPRREQASGERSGEKSGGSSGGGRAGE